MQERLQKLIAQAGVASRRAAEKLITEGAVTVNGQVVTELGTKADPEKDHIKVNGKLINLKIAAREKVYILLNKPKGYLSSAADPEGRKLVVDLVAKSFGKVHPVGRLDYNTEGLLILTNDGDFTNLVASSKKIPKVYEVKVKGLPPKVALNKLRRGTVLDDGFKTAPAEITELRATENNGWFEVTLHEGHNQQIRKMFDSIGHSVVKLKRVSIGGLADETLPVGAYRLLSESDVASVTKPLKNKTVKIEAKKSARSAPAREEARTKTEDFTRGKSNERPERSRTARDDSRRSGRDGERTERPQRAEGTRGRDKAFGRPDERRSARPAFKRDDFDERPRSRARTGEKPAFKRDDFDERPRPRAARSGEGRTDRPPKTERTSLAARAARNFDNDREDRPARRSTRNPSGGKPTVRNHDRAENTGAPRRPRKR